MTQPTNILDELFGTLRVEHDLDAILPDIIAYKDADVRNCSAILAAGSVMNNTAGRYSDVDLLFFVSHDDEITKRNLVWRGLILDLQIISINLLPRLSAISLKANQPVGIFTIAEGVVIWGNADNFTQLRAEASKGVAALKQSRIKSMGAAVWELVEDLRSICNAINDRERMIFGVAALDKITKIAVIQRSQNAVVSRSLIKTTVRNEPATLPDNGGIMTALLNGDISPLLSAARTVIGPYMPFTWERTAKLGL